MAYCSRSLTIGGFDHVGVLVIGGDAPVAVQTMWKDRLGPLDLEGEAGEAVIARIQGLQEMGCGLLRFAVPDLEAAEVLGRLASLVSMPLVADIHFDYRIALRCLDFPIAKIRINPGNIGSRDRVEAVLSKAALKGAPIRIGVNAGSLPQELRPLVDRGEISRAEALVQAAEREIAVCRELGFTNYLVSLKASSAGETVAANRLLAQGLGSGGPPLHVGVTEAGPLVAGTVRNTMALQTLLAEGIGDTIRVSLSGAMEHEVMAAREILSAMAPGPRFQSGGIRIVSCPRCGRNGFDTHSFTERWLPRLYRLPRTATVAIMGCVVNGPEEARHADLGITGAGDKVLIFRHGQVTRTIDAAQADAAFAEELAKL
ncbi:MAG: (E)-4-hydroxy-3-methylbut-2-enyl-diphosphate synthase [Treponema sp.]|jgi:(E)-4-hydroxy-3-methylbut-2-enyl-diphosphate synthase|nr:(E)-4-hydroxy-3-methylbut-2-enyl-diphosphate synthase [Treponema sp.]